MVSSYCLPFHDKLLHFSVPPFPPIWPFSLSSPSPLISLNVFLSHLHWSLPLLMLPVIYSVHLQMQPACFQSIRACSPHQQGEPIGSRGTQQPSCQHILDRERLKCPQSGQPHWLSTHTYRSRNPKTTHTKTIHTSMKPCIYPHTPAHVVLSSHLRSLALYVSLWR